MKEIVELILILNFLYGIATASNFTVKAGGGGNFTTIQACSNGMAAGDTCTVFAGTYNESVTVSAGTVGNYKTITVNGTDIVSVLGFTVGSHVKIIGNCPEKQGTVTTATCGFFIANTSNPRAGACVSGSGSVTDVYLKDLVMFACGNTTSVSFTSGSTFVYMLGLTISYPAITPGTISGCPNSSTCEGNAFLLIGNHFLIESGDFSHYTLGIDLNASQLFVRNSVCHDQHESEASGNAHTDCWFSEPGVGGAASTFNVFEGNTNSNGVGADAKTILAQNDGGSSACAGPSCFNLIERFNVVSNMGGGLNSPSEINSWPFIKFYNNTVVDGNAGGGSNGIINNLDAQTNAAQLNTIYYFNSLGTNNTVYTCGSGCNRGYNSYFCVTSCPSTVFPSDTGNKNNTDPKFVNYVSVGNASNDYHLQSSSPVRNAGINLTTVAATDSGVGTSLVVNDAAYFQDGYSLSNAFSTVNGDCISVTTVGNHVCVTAVNYSTNTLTLATGITRSVSDPVWLYSKSDGVQVLTGSAPDMGALPFVNSSVALSPTCAPSIASSVGPISINCTNPNGGTTVMCYTVNGSTPVSNGLGTGCATGTPLSGASNTILIASSVTTLTIIAGTSINQDSPANTYGPYKLLGNPPGTFVISGNVATIGSVVMQ